MFNSLASFLEGKHYSVLTERDGDVGDQQQHAGIHGERHKRRVQACKQGYAYYVQYAIKQGLNVKNIVNKCFILSYKPQNKLFIK